MSVAFGSNLSSANTNAAFVSKTDTSGNTVVGKIDLANIDAESIASISNVQKVINQESTIFRAVQTITASGQITIDERIKNHLILVVGDAGNVDASSTPFLAENAGSFLDGTIVTVIGTNDSQKVTMKNNIAANGAVQNGDSALGKFNCITYMRVTISAVSYWLERNRNS